MKKLSVLFVLAFVGLSLQSVAQTKSNTPSITVMLGNITPKYANGKQITTATKAEILANPQLVTPPPPCDINEFMFSYYPKGGEFHGPYTVKGSWLTPDIIKMIEEVNADECKIYIENIKVNCGNMPMTAATIIMTMVKQK